VKHFEVTIKPETGFGSSLKGDTIFGHFCWQAKYDPSLLNGGLDKWIAQYEKAPFAVFSSAWPKISADKPLYALKKPDIPFDCLFGGQGEKDRKARHTRFKEAKQKKWILVGENLRIDIKSARFATDSDLAQLAEKQLSRETRDRLRVTGIERFVSSFEQPHNTINRLTGTTGKGMFGPFSESAFHFHPEMELAIFVWVDEEATDIHRICKGLERIGQFGYGKNASTGLGRFGMRDCAEISLGPTDAPPNACYALGPVVPECEDYAELFFSPFIRFGKHGDVLARSADPFKNPIIMVDEGAILVPKDSSVFGRAYLGKAVLNTSKALSQSVAQGYSLFLPLRLEMWQ
jgi:CRISPR-associated protein Csm4